LLAPPVNALGLDVGVAASPAAEVDSSETGLPEGLTRIKLKLGKPVPVPATPPDEEAPVGYGADRIGTTVTVDLMTFTVWYCMFVLLIVVVEELGPSAPADD